MNFSSKIATLFAALPSLRADDPKCVADWQHCATTTAFCCNARFSCQDKANWNSCLPAVIKPMPTPPASKICGAGDKINQSLMTKVGVVTSRELAMVWSAATDGLPPVVPGALGGGFQTCVQAVSTALGECEHTPGKRFATIDDFVCTTNDIWQITSMDARDKALAGCGDNVDPCCNARIAWSHAWDKGGATLIPKDYCNKQSDCTQTVGRTGENWNDPAIDKMKPGAKIPNCEGETNPWYKDFSKLESNTVDQEPCYWGPFSIAAGGVGKEFFPGFYGWGGWFQHYMNSKAGVCDPSPQGNKCDPDDKEYSKYPTYYELAKMACKNITNDTSEYLFDEPQINGLDDTDDVGLFLINE